jgi:hypothetical protein
MTIRDYYFGRRITMRSSLRPDEIQQRIRDDTNVPIWWKPFQVGPVGRVRWGRLKLRFASSPFQYNAKPILVGLIERTMTGSTLRLAYRGSTWSRIFFVIWYGFIALMAVAFSTMEMDPSLRGTERFIPFGLIVLLALVPIGMHLFGTRRSDDELEQLIDFLDRVAQAKPSPE